MKLNSLVNIRKISEAVFGFTLVKGLACLGIAISSLGALPSGVVLADETRSFRINVDDTEYRFVNNLGEKKVTFYASLRGKGTAPFLFGISAPAGTRVEVDAALIGGNMERTLRSNRNWYDVLMSTSRLDSGTRAVNVIRANSRTASRMTISTAQKATFKAEPLALGCSYITDELVSFYQSFCAKDPAWTQASLCEELQSDREIQCTNNRYVPPGNQGTADNVGSIGGDESSTAPVGDNTAVDTTGIDYGQATFVGLLPRDACNTSSPYMVRVTLSFPEISNSRQFEVRFRGLLKEWQGGRESSLKPSGDAHGKYGGKPIMLMSRIGGNQGMRVVAWNRSMTPIAASTSRQIRVIDRNTAYWRGLALARADLSSVINGFSSSPYSGTVSRAELLRARKSRTKLARSVRKGSRVNFELFSDSSYSAYSVCMRLDRRRQSVEGYPK